MWGAGHQRRHVSQDLVGDLWPGVPMSEFELVFSSCRPLHLAIIHQQAGVIQQLIQTLLSSQQQSILNTANHLLQVGPASSALTSLASCLPVCFQLEAS